MQPAHPDRIRRGPLAFVKKLGGVAAAALQDYLHRQVPAAGGGDRVSSTVLDRASGDRARRDLRARFSRTTAFANGRGHGRRRATGVGGADVRTSRTRSRRSRRRRAPSDSLGLFVFLWAATGMMAAIRQGLETALNVTESRPMLRGKLVDLALVAGAARARAPLGRGDRPGRLRATASDDVADTTGAGADVLGGALLRGASFALSTVVVLLLYRFVPARGLRIRDGLAGAIVTAVLLQMISLGLELDLREDDRAQRHLRLAHGGARLSLLPVPLRVRPAAGCRGGRRVVPAPNRRRRRRTRPDPHAAQASRPRALRQAEDLASCSSNSRASGGGTRSSRSTRSSATAREGRAGRTSSRRRARARRCSGSRSSAGSARAALVLAPNSAIQAQWLRAAAPFGAEPGRRRGRRRRADRLPHVPGARPARRSGGRARRPRRAAVGGRARGGDRPDAAEVEREAAAWTR